MAIFTSTNPNAAPVASSMPDVLAEDTADQRRAGIWQTLGRVARLYREEAHDAHATMTRNIRRAGGAILAAYYHYQELGPAGDYGYTVSVKNLDGVAPPASLPDDDPLPEIALQDFGKWLNRPRAGMPENITLHVNPALLERLERLPGRYVITLNGPWSSASRQVASDHFMNVAHEQLAVTGRQLRAALHRLSPVQVRKRLASQDATRRKKYDPGKTRLDLAPDSRPVRTLSAQGPAPDPLADMKSKQAEDGNGGYAQALLAQADFEETSDRSHRGPGMDLERWRAAWLGVADTLAALSADTPAVPRHEGVYQNLQAALNNAELRPDKTYPATNGLSEEQDRILRAVMHYVYTELRSLNSDSRQHLRLPTDELGAVIQEIVASTIATSSDEPQIKEASIAAVSAAIQDHIQARAASAPQQVHV